MGIDSEWQRRRDPYDNAYLALRTLHGVVNAAIGLKAHVMDPSVSAAEAAAVLLESRAVLERLLALRRRLMAREPPASAPSLTGPAPPRQDGERR
jgi:hypothetical protein